MADDSSSSVDDLFSSVPTHIIHDDGTIEADPTTTTPPASPPDSPTTQDPPTQDPPPSSSQAEEAHAEHVAFVHKKRREAAGEHHALIAFERSRSEMAVALEAHEKMQRGHLVTRLGSGVRACEQLVGILVAQAKAGEAYAVAMRGAAGMAAEVADLGSMGDALGALGSADLAAAEAYEEFLELLGRELIPRAKALAKKVTAEANRLGRAIADATNELTFARNELDGRYARHVKVVEYRGEVSDALKAGKGGKISDPWLTQHQYKQALRKEKKVAAAMYRPAMGAVFSDYAQLEVERGATFKAILDDLYTARKVLHMKASGAIDEPKRSASVINGKADVAAFTKASFSDPAPPDVTKGSKFLKFASPHIVKSGMLSLQKGALFSSWKPHLFVLSCEGYLHHFAPDKTAKDLATEDPALSIYLPAFTLHPGPHPKHGVTVFELRQVEKGWFSSRQTLLIKAESAPDRRAWEASIRAVCHSVQQLPVTPLGPMDDAGPSQPAATASPQ